MFGMLLKFLALFPCLFKLILFNLFKTKYVTGDWDALHSEKVNDLYSSQIVRA
jgi:hypothetical protein